MISIVTSLFRTESHLPRFLKNAKKVHFELKNQRIAFEHILIANDCSSEEAKMLQRSGLNFKIFTVPRETLYASWNRGVRESAYRYVTFWAVDDIRFAKAFIEGAKNLSRGFDATYFPYIYKRYVRVFGVKILVMVKIVNPIDYNPDLFMVGMYAGPHFMFTKEAFNMNGEFKETFKIAGDFDWWVRATKNNLRIIKTPTLSGIFNNDGMTLSGSKNKLQAGENAIIAERK